MLIQCSPFLYDWENKTDQLAGSCLSPIVDEFVKVVRTAQKQ